MIRDEIRALLYRVAERERREFPRTPVEEQLPPGITAEQVRLWEEVLGREMPEELHWWLSLSNGPGVGSGYFLGSAPERSFADMLNTLERRPAWKARGWVPVAGDGCGSHWVVDLNAVQTQLPVYFVDCMSDRTVPTYIAASNLLLFLKFTLSNALIRDDRRRTWPFKERWMREQDPELLLYQGVVPLPWEA